MVKLPARSLEIDRLLAAALELPSDAERGPFIAHQCAGDPVLEERVRALLRLTEVPNNLFVPAGAQQGPLWQEVVQQILGQAPLHVGRYRVIRKIGEGGMAEVYLGVRADGHVDQRVALKVLKVEHDRPPLAERFRRESQILASLEHPGIARLIDVGVTSEGRPFLAMEYVDGQPIDRYCDEHRLTVEQRLELFLSVARAVHYAHQNLVVHRDVKSSNVLVTRSGHVKLLDFGIARLLAPGVSDPDAPPTGSGLRLMTPECASPEQVRGAPVTTASDTYQLGLLLYELLTGCRPYRLRQLSAGDVEHTICETDPVPPSSAAVGRGSIEPTTGSASVDVGETCRARSTRPNRLRRRLRGDIDAIVMVALRKEPRHRYPSVDGMVRDLALHLAGRPITVRHGERWYRFRRFVRRNAALLAALLTAAALFAGLGAYHTNRLARERDRARLETAKVSEIASYLEGLFRLADPMRPSMDGPSALELLDRGARRVDSELAGQPELQAELMGLLGRIHLNLGLPDRAEPLLRRAVEVLEKLEGADPLDLASRLNDLAILLERTGRYPEVEPLYRRVLEIRERELGPDHLLVASVVNNLAVLYDNQGRFDEAEPLYRRSLDLRERARGPQSNEVAQSLNNLGSMLVSQGRFGEAEVMLLEALSIRERTCAPDHPDLQQSLGNLASLYATQGRHEAAEELFLRSLVFQQERLGERHPLVARTLGNLAALCLSTGRLDEAEVLLDRAQAALEATYDGHHPELAGLINTRAKLHVLRGELDQAVASFRRAAAITEESLGPRHHGVAGCLANLARALAQRGDLEEAARTYRRAVEILDGTVAAADPRLLWAVHGLAGVLEAEGELDKAEELYLRSLDLRRKVTAQVPPDEESIRADLGRVREGRSPGPTQP